MKNGTFLGEDYFERLLSEIREIRLSERKFYQKITDIYPTFRRSSFKNNIFRPPSR
ncbi:MAG: RhuM family protein, partial [Methanomicrobiales archaeon]